MLGVAKQALTCLLLLSTLDAHTSAARTKEQRRALGDPYWVTPPGSRPHEALGGERALGEREFTLRHIYHHGTHDYPQLHRYMDVPKDAKLMITDDYGVTQELAPEKLTARAVSTNIQRMTDRQRTTIDGLLNYAQVHGEAASLPADAWTVDEIAGPNVTHKPTVLTFARIASNAYVTDPNTGDWQDVRGGFNYTDDFGWELDGLRGHIFADETNSTIVIGLKGTTMALFDGAETTTNDKLNDNLFGSCCCGQGGQYLWRTVCSCMTSTYTCNNTCLVESLQDKSHYYWAARDLYHNVTERYPNATDIWMSGHSLGGVVSTLLGLTYGLPVMTFEAFPDAMAASRLGLPTPPGYRIGSHQSRAEVALHHFGHTADPIFMGTCNTASSGCTVWGYAFQGVCHTGKTCIYNTVEDLGWRPSVLSHRIVSVIKDVLEMYDEVPVCEEDIECPDCPQWKFYESNSSETTTTSSGTSTSTRTRTRTETCRTPGWWGCLDETTTTSATTTTTTSATTTTTTSSSSTSTCKTPGWFGCKDPTATTSSSATTTSNSAAPVPTITTTSSIPTSTSSCMTPGWFGCNDPTATSSAPRPSVTTSQPSTTSTATTCTSKEWFGLICVDPSPTTSTSTSKPSSTNLPTARRKSCVRRRWYGACGAWRWEGVEPKSDL